MFEIRLKPELRIKKKNRISTYKFKYQDIFGLEKSEIIKLNVLHNKLGHLLKEVCNSVFI